MVATIDLEITYRGKTTKDVAGVLNSIASQLDLNKSSVNKAAKNHIRKYLNKIADDMERMHSGPYSGSSRPEDRLMKRSGRGVNSIRKSIKVKGSTFNNTIGLIGGNSYLVIQEFGGTITPKSKEYLTVPLPSALKPNGLPKKQSARDWDNTFVLRSDAGNLLIMRKKGRNAEPLYLLAKSVKIKPRLNMRRSAHSNMKAFADTLANAIVQELTKVPV